MRLVLIIIVGLLLPLSVGANEARIARTQAMMDAVRAEDWVRANRVAAQIGTVARDIVEWHRLRRGGVATFGEYRDFIARNGDWPGQASLLNRGESALPEGGDPQAILTWFGNRVPRTGAGVLRLISAYQALDLEGDALALAVLAWRSLTLSPETESELLAAFPTLLASHHEARLDDLLWRKQRSAARRMLPRVSEGWQKLARARLALMERAGGVDTLIEAVPAALQSHPGLAYERFDWRVSKRRNEGAIEIITDRSTSPERLGRPEKWGNWRRIYARKVLREGDPAAAYRLASNHFLLDGSNFADLEWLSGFIALRFFDDPELALLHFDRFRTAVATPISLGRAGYWQGRAYSALGQDVAAKEAYAFGAAYQSSFYGLLSAEAIGADLESTLSGREVFPSIAKTELGKSGVLAAALLFHEAGEAALSERFLAHMIENRTRQEAGSIAQVGLALNDPHLSLMIAKRAARDGHILPEAYFPLHPMAKQDHPVPTELALAIARRESEFNPAVVSPAGAMGLMQVMPGTARDVAGELKIAYEKSRLTSDPGYNIRLGTAYLAGLIEIFGPAPVLVAVGYNAGPGRAVSWVENNGDPRTAGTDIIDWIELIPFRETRNYVMRVTESIAVYRARLGQTVGPVTFTKFLRTGKF